jgi:hypothetical protein
VRLQLGLFGLHLLKNRSMDGVYTDYLELFMLPLAGLIDSFTGKMLACWVEASGEPL